MKKNNDTYKKKKIYKKGIALVTSAIMGVSGYVLSKQNDNKDLITFASADDVTKNINKGDSIITTDNINLRLDTSTDSFKLGVVGKGNTLNRIISVNGFDLVKYDDKLAFVSTEYTDSNIQDYNNEYYYVIEDTDIIHTTTQVNFRLGPSTNENKICLLDKNAELSVIGKSISYTDQNDIWYLAKYQDKIGFVKAEYTISLKNTIQQIDSNITDVKIKNIGYIRNDSIIYDNLGNFLDYAEKYQIVKILDKVGNNYLIEYDNLVGFIPQNDIHKYEGTFVVVDLSDQEIYLYCNTDLVFKSKCTTGADITPTRTGAFSVYERTNSRYFSEDAQSRYMWANFDHGNGIHDAPWENPKKFGNEKYRKNNGSKGCVRLPDEAAIFLKDHIKYGTKVLVKK